MTITLGQASNYKASQVFRHLFACGTQRHSAQLRESLAERYAVQPENVALYHTGRSALSAAIRSIAAGGHYYVIIPGLTCIAVVRAVRAAGCEPVFVDIIEDNLEYNYTKLAQKLAELANQVSDNAARTAKPASELLNQAPRNTTKNTNVSSKSSDLTPDNASKTTGAIDKTDDVCYNGIIILVQNTLGLSWHVSRIESLAHKYHAEIVEDLAHSAGRVYPDGREVGTVGSAVALSFGKGKAIDTIEGGALILRSQKVDQPQRLPKLSDRLRDRWYPLFGLISRSTGKLGRILMGGLVKIHFVQRSADAELNLDHRLTHWQARLANQQLAQLPQTPLREYRLVHHRAELLSKLRQNGYRLDEIWYDTPVSPVRYTTEADFPTAECPTTVKISQTIINFPTWYPENRLATAYKITKEYEIDE